MTSADEVQRPGTNLRILCVGTGGDDMRALYAMLRYLLDRAGWGQAAYDYRSRNFNRAFCDYRETGDPAYLNELKQMIAESQYTCIAGTSYAPLLPLFAEQHGRGLKLVHLRRADRAACIAALKRDFELFPSAYGYYAPGAEPLAKRMTAVHFDEMTRADWERLTIEEMFAWYYDKTHALLAGYRPLFDESIEITAESLGDETTRRALARIVTGTGFSPPPAPELGPVAIDISSVPAGHRDKLHWLLQTLDLGDVARDDVHASAYFLERFVAWVGYQINDAPQLGHTTVNPPDMIEADLERAMDMVKERLGEMESLCRDLRERRASWKPAPAMPHVNLARARAESGMNDLAKHAAAFELVTPWSGFVPAGYTLDFLGIVTPKEFHEPWGYHPAFVDGAPLKMERPALGKDQAGEDFWFEALNWLLAARQARGEFVMMTLGALHGYQAVGSQRALQLLNPMPYKLVAVEPIPENVQRMRRFMRDNGIDPDEQWIVQAVVSDTNEPAFFPVGAPGAGCQNCVSANNDSVREYYVKQFIMEDRAEEALRNLLLHNSTGLQKELSEGRNMIAEIKLLSCVTLRDLLGPFDRVDYIEADMQESEIRVFPPFLDLLRRKVKRIHIATHGRQVHADLHGAFAAHGWEIVFSYAPDSTHASPWGEFTTNDGVLTVLNPDL